MTNVLLNGTARWSKVRTPVKSFDEKFDQYTIDVILNDEGWAEFKKSGLQLKPRVYDDGDRYVQFRRKQEEMNYGSGKIEVNGPPEIFLKDEETGIYNKWPKGNIGNGSDVSVSIEVYKTRNGMGHRLARIWINKLVPFEGGSDRQPTPDSSELPF